MNQCYQLTPVERRNWRKVSKESARAEVMLRAHIRAGEPNEAGKLSDAVMTLEHSKFDLQWAIVQRIRKSLTRGKCRPGTPHIDRLREIDDGGHIINIDWPDPS